MSFLRSHLSTYTDAELRRWFHLRAIEWAGWPAFISQPLVPILLVFVSWVYVLATLLIIDFLWCMVSQSLVNAHLANLGALFVIVFKWPAAIGGAIYFSHDQHYGLAAMSLLWPMLAGFIGLPARIFFGRLLGKPVLIGRVELVLAEQIGSPLGFWKKRTLRRKIAVALKLGDDYGLREATSDDEQNAVFVKAAAAANYLYGKSPSPMHAHLDLVAGHMFGFLLGFWKKRTFRRMERLVAIAQIAVALKLGNDYGLREATSDDEQNAVVAKAAAAANYLFGKSPSPMHAHLDLVAEHAAAREWLKANPAMRELVVQSLRVANVIGWGRSGALPEIGRELLEAFGMEYPDSPEVDTYEALVRRIVAAMPPSREQQRLAAALG